MKNFILTGFVSLLFVCLCSLVYSCSEDDTLEHNDNVRSLSKRTIYSKEGVEETPSTSEDVYGVEAGSYSGTSNDGYFSVSASWTRGYTTRNPYSTVSVSASPSSNSKLINCEVLSVSGDWIGSNYNIHGTIDYKYSIRTEERQLDGTISIKLTPQKGSTSFDLNPTVSTF